MLATSPAQIMALLHRRELVGVQIGGRGHWRIERLRLEEYIARCYEEADRRRNGQPPETLDAAVGDPAWGGPCGG